MVFYWGQNDFQPQDRPSLSMGDVIALDGQTWLVAGIGFKKMSDDKLSEYMSIPLRDRFLYGFRF